MKNIILIILILTISVFSCKSNMTNNSKKDNHDTVSQENSTSKQTSESLPIKEDKKYESKSDTDNNSITKSLQIHDQLAKKGINSYYSLDTFFIIDKNNKLISKQYLPFKGLETNYSVEQFQDHKYLFLVLRFNEDVTSLRFYLIDLNNRKLIINQDRGCTGYVGSSEDNRYHAFEYGSSCGREFLIFNSGNKFIKEGGYPGCLNNKSGCGWIGNKFYYFSDCEKGAILPKNLPPLKEQEIYMQKYFWTNGKDSATNEFIVNFVE